jgi:membrane protein implicated in regulation of membrane protease activity
LENVKDTLLSQMKSFFNEKAMGLYGYLLAVAGVGTAVFKIIADSKLPTQMQAGIFLTIGVVALIATWALLRKSGREK